MKEKSREYVTMQVTWTQEQAEGFKKVAEAWRAKDLGDLVNRAMHITSVLADGLKGGKELVFLDRSKTKLIKTEEGDKVALLTTQSNLEFLTENLMKHYEFQEEVQKWNAFGLPLTTDQVFQA
jgi:hypothetical protein